MKNCPTSNMNRSKLWGFEVSQIIAAFIVLAGSNVVLNLLGLPLIFSWLTGVLTLTALRIISHGKKSGHLELLARFMTEPHVYLGHRNRSKKKEIE